MAENERRSCHGENNGEEEARGSGRRVKDKEGGGIADGQTRHARRMRKKKRAQKLEEEREKRFLPLKHGKEVREMKRRKA